MSNDTRFTPQVPEPGVGLDAAALGRSGETEPGSGSNPSLRDNACAVNCASNRSRRPRMLIWVITTTWGVYSAPETAVRFYSKKVRRRLFGYSSQVGESAHPALILWPRGDSIWLPMFAIDKIERKWIEVLA